MNAGRLIAFEGLDGCGKSSQLARLRALLDPTRAVFTREPTDGPYGQRIREAARRAAPLDPGQELSWFMADRAEHVEATIAPALAAGKSVLTDRYFLSSVAYQGARGLDWREILRESEARFPVPDLVVLLTVAAETGIGRVEARAGTLEPLFERIDFQQKVAAIFASLERPYITRIDAARDEASVAADVQAAVLALVAER